MALLFSHVRVSTPDGNDAEFLVSGIPREFDDFEYYTAFEDFLDGIEEDTEISVHAEAYLYGEGETFKASIEEVAYFHLRMQQDENFLDGHCDNIESVDFTCNYEQVFVDMNYNPDFTEISRCITGRYTAGISNRRGEHSGVYERFIEGPRAILTPDRKVARQQGRRMKDPEEPMFTLTAQDHHGIVIKDRIRKLMPIECWRLQGFTDEQFFRAQRDAKMSDARLYKMAGNAVSVPVITELGAIIKRVHENSQKEADNG